MRLIDGDALMYEANSDGAYGYVDAKQISEAPTIDAVPVVRCRECVGRAFWEKDHNDVPVCLLSGLYVKSENDFCPYGERKEGADNG